MIVCPDGSLTALPWAALPGRESDSYLLEDYSLSVVPNGQFLLDLILSRDRSKKANEGIFLAVGDVQYDAKPTEQVPEAQRLALRSAAFGKGRPKWPQLAETEKELAEIVKLAKNRSVLELRRAEASTTRVLEELRKAETAHLATHGFFADPNVRSVLQMDERQFRQWREPSTNERTSVAGRNPLLLSGLVLAGANLPRPSNALGISEADVSILFASAKSAVIAKVPGESGRSPLTAGPSPASTMTTRIPSA